MKHIMYVFSATGNTLHVAKLVRDQLKGEQVTICPVREKQYSIIQAAEAAEVIGIYYPCYYGSMPHLVERFIAELRIRPEAYIYSVVTAGGSAGYCNKELNSLLASKGLKLSLGAEVIYSSNYMPGWYYSMVLRSQKKVRKNLNRIKTQTEIIAKRILGRVKKPIKGSYFGYRMPKILTPSYLVKDTRPYDSEYSIGSQCSQCGVCAKVCPVGNIELKNGQHQFNQRCERCMACVQHCPKQAFVIKGKAMNKERYVNPFVTIQEIIDLHETRCII